MRQPTMNKLHNLSNPNQGGAKRVLCVCSAGLLRSPTAAIILQKDFGFNTRSCGCNRDYALIDLDEVLMNWANEIVIMEDYMILYIPKEFRSKTICLDIQDKYEYMNPTLVRLIKEKYEDYLSRSH